MPAKWTSIGVGLYCPVLVSPRRGRVVLVARTASGDLACQEKDDAGWGVRRSLGVPVASSPGSTVTVPVDWQLGGCAGVDGEADLVDLVARSPDGDLLHLQSTLADPVGFDCLGAPAVTLANRAVTVGIASPPAVCRSAPDRLEVFALGPGGELLHVVRTGDDWGPFDPLGAPAQSVSGRGSLLSGAEAIAACSCGASRVAVFRRGPHGDLLLKWWDGSAWSEYVSLGSPQVPDASYPAVTVSAPLTGPPAACSWGATRLDVFARGPDGDLMHVSWNGDDWSGFCSIGMPVVDGQVVPFSGVVGVCSSDVGSCDVVAGAVDGCLYHMTWSNDAQ